MRKLFFVSCTRSAKEETPLFHSLQKLQIPDFHFFEHNQSGLSQCYNEWLGRLAGTDVILVFVHSDVSIADVFIHEKINAAIAEFQIVGLAGSSVFDPRASVPHFGWPVWPRPCLSGAVEHPVENGRWRWYVLGPTPARCVVLDGLFLAIDMLRIGSLRFDNRFTFHHYDLDFCFTAHNQKLALGTAGIYIRHASKGNFTSPEYQRSMQIFQDKWGGRYQPHELAPAISSSVLPPVPDVNS